MASGPFGEWLTWRNVGTAALVVTFLWTQYRQFEQTRGEESTLLARLQEHDEAQSKRLDDMQRVNEARLRDLEKRLDVQRGDIGLIQQQIMNARGESGNGGRR